MAPWICETVVDGEDFWVAGRTEPGVRSGVLDTVVLGRNEPAPQHLHRGFAAALRATAERGPPASAGTVIARDRSAMADDAWPLP
jgi:choline monooxygenase